MVQPRAAREFEHLVHVPPMQVRDRYAANGREDVFGKAALYGLGAPQVRTNVLRKMRLDELPNRQGAGGHVARVNALVEVRLEFKRVSTCVSQGCLGIASKCHARTLAVPRRGVEQAPALDATFRDAKHQSRQLAVEIIRLAGRLLDARREPVR